MQNCSISIANTLEKLQSCTKPSILAGKFVLCLQIYFFRDIAEYTDGLVQDCSNSSALAIYFPLIKFISLDQDLKLAFCFQPLPPGCRSAPPGVEIGAPPWSGRKKHNWFIISLTIYGHDLNAQVYPPVYGDMTAMIANWTFTGAQLHRNPFMKSSGLILDHTFIAML